jgi:hypothetical protein
MAQTVATAAIVAAFVVTSLPQFAAGLPSPQRRSIPSTVQTRKPQPNPIRGEANDKAL